MKENIRYETMENFDLEGKIPRQYGIRVMQNNTTIRCIADISTDKGFVDKIAKCMTENQLSIMHLDEYLEDVLA